MDRGYPSMTALLGLLAVAGFQNRDKIAELLGSGQRHDGQPAGPGAGSGLDGLRQGSTQGAGGSGLGGLLQGLGGAGAAGGIGGLISNGLGELVERFRNAGHEETAQSWVGTGPNRAIAPHELEQAIGPDTLSRIAAATGLTADDVLSRLSRDLPDAVDRYTPDGRLGPAQA